VRNANLADPEEHWASKFDGDEASIRSFADETSMKTPGGEINRCLMEAEQARDTVKLAASRLKVYQIGTSEHWSIGNDRDKGWTEIITCAEVTKFEALVCRTMNDFSKSTKGDRARAVVAQVDRLAALQISVEQTVQPALYKVVMKTIAECVGAKPLKQKPPAASAPGASPAEVDAQSIAPSDSGITKSAGGRGRGRGRGRS